MKPSLLLDESKVVVDISASTRKVEVIARLVRLAVAGEADSEPIIADLLAREAAMTTGIGQGIAIPHTRSALVARPLGALGVSRDGIEFEALDEEPVHIIFVFITPIGAGEVHAQVLRAVAEVFYDSAVREAVRKAASPADVLALIRSREA